MSSSSPQPKPAAMTSAEDSYQTPAATPTSGSPAHTPPPKTELSPEACTTPSTPFVEGPGASEVASQPARRGRRSGAKVKTGCSNCKRRRIKCDETRPACRQCIKSKKVCTGYPAPSRDSTRSGIDIRIAPRPVASLQPAQPAQQPLRPAPNVPTNIPTTASLLLRGHSVVLPPRRRRRQVNSFLVNPHTPTAYQPTNNLALKHTESLYFELFRVQTASELSGYFNSTFWTQRVLQECHFEPSIRHAVVALGALYKTLEQSFEPESTYMPGAMGRLESVMCHWQVAVNQYSEACRATAELNGGNLSTNRTRLMASVLLTCFDSFIGDHKQAISQIQTGLSLLDRIQSDQAQCLSPGPGEYMEEDLLVIFTRLAIQAKSYDMAFHFPRPYVIQLGPQGWRDPSSPVSKRGSPSASSLSPLPVRFESLREARLASDMLCETLLRFIEHLQYAQKDPSYTLPASWRGYGATFKGQIDAWASAFEHIYQSRLSPHISLLEKSGISALKMFQINTNVLFLMMFCDSEVSFDAFLPHFQDIVRLGWEVVGDDEKRAAADRCPNPNACHHQHAISKGALRAGKYTAHHIKPSFSADLGIVPPLFVVATKCREPTVRRQAIQLLRSSARREGMWDSELAANIGQWIMQFEESEELFPGMPVLGSDPSTALPNRAIPEERRVMVQAVDFDLRARYADVRVGSRREALQHKQLRATRLTW